MHRGGIGPDGLIRDKQGRTLPVNNDPWQWASARTMVNRIRRTFNYDSKLQQRYGK